MPNFEFFHSNNETFESFVSGKLGCKENFSKQKLKGLVNEEFDNILYCPEGYEIEIKNLHNGYYEFISSEIPKVSTIFPRFGCELELCFVINCGKDNKEEIEKILEGEKITKSGLKWRNLIYYHLRNNIIPNLTKKFTNIFRFAYIKPSSTNFDNAFLLDMISGKIVNKSYIDNEYKTLIFEPDGTIECIKSQNKDLDGNIYETIPIACEIVTPILESVKDLKILYEGLIFKNNGYSCVQNGESMGFHVNVSAVNEKGKIYNLTKGMFSELIYDWIKYEKINYKKLRGVENNKFSQSLQNYLNNEESIRLLSSNIKNKNGEEIKDSQLNEPYSLSMKYMIHLLNTYKYLSMTHHKGGNVIEFRLFNSVNDIDTLLSYTQDAIDIFINAIKRYCKNPVDTIVKLQENNLKYKYIEFTTPFDKAMVYDSSTFDVYLFKRYLSIRGDSSLKLIYSEESKFWGFMKERVYHLDLFSLIFDVAPISNKYSNTYIVIYYDEIDKYYRYDIIFDDKIYIQNPIEITKKEFKLLENESKVKK
jgi:hypothetical protein